MRSGGLLHSPIVLSVLSISLVATASPTRPNTGPPGTGHPPRGAPQDQKSQAPVTSAQVRRDLLGKAVQDRNGERVGELQDVILDKQTGTSPFALIASGGFLGIGTQERPVPIQLISTATAIRNVIELRAAQVRWSLAPRFDSDNLAQLADPQRIQEIDSFYGISNPHGNLAAVKRGSVPTPTGRQTGLTVTNRNPQAAVELASDLVGQDVLNRQQEPIGEISDLLVDLSGKLPTFAIVSAGRMLNSEKRFAVPLRLISMTNGNAVLDANRQLLEQAKPFTQQAWASGESAIYRYNGA